MYRVEKFNKNDYDDLLNFFNINFERLNEHSFKNFLPPMWHRDDVTLSKSFGIKKEGEIIAAMGLYPLQLNVCGKKLTFATTGNIAVKAEYRNLGLMKSMMDFCFQELKNQNIDVARLGGERLRYNRYGYEFMGSSNNYILTSKNLKALPLIENYTFKPIDKNDEKALTFVKELYSSKPFFVDRGNPQNIYDVMSEFYGKLYLASSKDSVPIGVLSASEDKDRIFDFYAKDELTEFNMICAFLKTTGLSAVHFSSPIWAYEFNQIAGKICENLTVDYSTQCRIENWEKTIDAFSNFENSLNPNRCNESIVLEIKDYGKFEIDCKSCKTTNKTPDLTLDSLTAIRLLFGFQSPENIYKLPTNKTSAIKKLFPLPFWWNTLDRV